MRTRLTLLLALFLQLAAGRPLLADDGSPVSPRVSHAIGAALLAQAQLGNPGLQSGTASGVHATDGTAAAPSITFASAPTNGFYLPSASSIGVTVQGTEYARFGAGLVLRSNASLVWSSGAIGSAQDSGLYLDAASTLAQRNGTNAQTLRLYNTYTDASNYSRLSTAWDGTDLSMTIENLGTGAGRHFAIGPVSATGQLRFRTNGTLRWSVNESGHLLAGADNTYDIGSSGANRPRDVYAGRYGFAGTLFQAPSFAFNALGILTSAVDGVITASNSAATVVKTLNGTLTTSTTSTCTAANTTETDLWTYSLPAGALNADGRGLRITAFGTTGATANNKTVNIYWNGVAYTFVSASAANAGSWKITTEILRDSATSQVISHFGNIRASAVDAQAMSVTTGAATMANAITIKVTGQNGTAAANDICIKGAIVETIR